MNPKRQFRRLRDDDRWTGLPPSTPAPPVPASGDSSSRPRRTYFATGVAFVVAGLVAVGLWAGLSALHSAQPASPEPLPFSTSRATSIALPCVDAARLKPIGCATYTAFAAAGVTGGTKTWAGATPPTFTIRVLSGKVTALINTGCNELTIPITLSTTELVPSSGVLMTSELCSGARSAQEHWLVGLFGGPVAYTLDGGELRLSAGTRTLDLTATPDVAPSTTPTTRAPRPSGSPSKSTVINPAAGCVATTATTPTGASTAPIADVDGDGEADTEWAVQAAGGTLQFGITTASGATIAGSQGFAGGGDRTFVAGKLANGVVVAITSEGRDSPVYTFSSCAFHTLQGKDLLPGTNATSPFTLYSDTDGGDGGCYDGRLALVRLTRMPGSSSDDKAVARWIDVSADGQHATFTNKTATIASNLNIDTDRTRYFHYNGISCGMSKVLRPTYHAH